MVGVNNVKFAAGIQDRKLDVENALKMAAEDDGFVTYNELRENLKHSNFSDVEIDLFFNMFSEDPSMADMLIDEDEARERELEEERLLQMEKMLEEDDSDDSEDEDEDVSLTCGSGPWLHTTLYTHCLNIIITLV